MSDRPTPEEIVDVVRGVLGDAPLAAYLYGSATDGGLRWDSDIDVLGVVGRPLDDAERGLLVQRLMEISGRRARRGPSRSVELTLVAASDVRPWRYPPRMEFQYGDWLRPQFEAGVAPEPADNPDLATLLAMVRQSGRPLMGPPPTEVLEPVPPADLRRALLDSLPDLLADLEIDRNVLLTLARMWYTLETGAFAPKDVAAVWALDRLPAELGAPLAHARGVYLGEAEDRPIDVPAVRALAARLAAEIERAPVPNR